MSKTLTVIFLAITLGGCIPLPISLGVSGWSYLVSGKSPTDHLISQTINQDCKILRLAVGKEPCAAFTNGERSLVWAVLRGDRERAAVTCRVIGCYAMRCSPRSPPACPAHLRNWHVPARFPTMSPRASSAKGSWRRSAVAPTATGIVGRVRWLLPRLGAAENLWSSYCACSLN